MQTDVELTRLGGRIDKNDVRIDQTIVDIGELKIEKVSISDFNPVRELVYGFAKLILTTVALALIYTVIKK